LDNKKSLRRPKTGQRKKLNDAATKTTEETTKKNLGVVGRVIVSIRQPMRGEVGRRGRGAGGWTVVRWVCGVVVGVGYMAGGKRWVVVCFVGWRGGG